MSEPTGRATPAGATLGALLAIAKPPRGRFALSVLLGAAAAMSTVALMACSGALIDKAALRPPLYTLTVLMAMVQIFALARGPLALRRAALRTRLGPAGHRPAARLALRRARATLARSPRELAQRRPALPGDGRRRLAPGRGASRASHRCSSGSSPRCSPSVSSRSYCPWPALSSRGASRGRSLLSSRQPGHANEGSARERRRCGASSRPTWSSCSAGRRTSSPSGRDEEYLERALADDEALARLARRRAWTAGAVVGAQHRFCGLGRGRPARSRACRPRRPSSPRLHARRPAPRQPSAPSRS